MRGVVAGYGCGEGFVSIEGCNAWGDVDFAVAHFGGMSFVSLCYFVIFKLFIGQRAAEMQLQHQELQRELQIYTEENNCANVRYIKQLPCFVLILNVFINIF